MFVPAGSIHRKQDFMGCINNAGGRIVMCSFDRELCDFFLQKKRNTPSIPSKIAVTSIGQQDNGQWILNECVCIGEDGQLVDLRNTSFCWVKSLLAGSQELTISIPLPLSVKGFSKLISQLEKLMAHNIFPTLLMMGAAVMGLHYKTILLMYQSCPIPLAFGPSGTGKTTALRCALSVVGAHNTRFFSRATLPKLIDVCSKSSIPIGVDDPSFQKHIDNLSIELFNGACNGNISRGLSVPTTTALISANFTSSSKDK